MTSPGGGESLQHISRMKHGRPIVLALDQVSKSFGEFLALDNAHFDLREGEIHALLGENGAGKSTLMNVVAGLYTPDSGSIRVSDESVAISGPGDAQALQIGMVHQHYKLVMPFSVAENVLLANPQGRYTADLAAMRSLISQTAERVGFDIDPDATVGSLSIAEQQRVELLKVLVAGARIIILDEPTAVLTDEEGRRILQAVSQLAEQGSSVVLVTHKLDEALSYSDRITVMRAGKVVRTVQPDQVDESELTRMIVGETILEEPRLSDSIGSPQLSLSNIRVNRGTGAPAIDGLSFHVCAGEIYGIAGVGGNGQTELVDLLTGLCECSGGEIQLTGHGDITRSRTDERRRYGIACIPSDRQAWALAGSLSICDNFSISRVLSGEHGSWFVVDRASQQQVTNAAVERFDVQGVRSKTQRAALLSGGNAQKLVIAREFSGNPVVVIAHSPSRGLDVRAAAAVHDRLDEARSNGAAVILISEDLDEIMLLADRIGVMNSGAIVAEFDAADTDRVAIGRAMVSRV